MWPIQYRLAVVVTASLSLALAACSSAPPAGQASNPANGAKAQQAANKASDDDDIDTEATIWTVLGLAKRQSYRQPGPQTGSTVSPILWQASLDTLNFVKFASEDPLGGSIVTDWYSPPDKPNERMRINVFILSRALRSDSIAVTVDRQERSATGQWADTTIARQVEDDLETTILHRARQLRRAWASAPS
jgi:hypothetical protein